MVFSVGETVVYPHHGAALIEAIETRIVSLTEVFDVLRAPHTEEPTNWSRRFKANVEKLASGNPLKVAEVVRDLWRRERERGLSAGEKRMLARARDILVGEVALAEKSTKDEAEGLLDKVLAEA
jgi:CarD family transcriptional regulator